LNWQPSGRPNSFKIVNGTLQGTCTADDSHGPAISVPVTASNLTIQFEMKIITPGTLLFLVDGASQFGGQAHLLRLGLNATSMSLAQDRGSLESKQAQKKDRDDAQKAGRKATPPSKDQLSDPKFYRTEPLARQPVKLHDGQWHKVLLTIRGNETAAQLDSHPTLKGTATVLATDKSKLVFLVGQSGVIQVDNVKVWSL
jgi:hypothetical protein